MKTRTAILALMCLAASWYYALSLAAAGGNGIKPGFANDYGPIWNVSRAILGGVDPYGPAVTEQNQISEYGATAKVIGDKNDQVFPYPVQAAFPFLTLGLLSFRVADAIIFCTFAILVALSVGWLRGIWDSTTLLYAILTLASYPIISTLQMRQPSLFFFAVGVASLALLRSGRFVAAGLLAALVVGKPQVSGSILLPMLIWALAHWSERWRFVASVAASALAIFCVSILVVPGWIPHWFAALRSYSQYVQPSLPVLAFGKQLGLAATVVVALILLAMLWRYRHRDLLFQVAFCATGFYLITQFVLWNAIVLLIPSIWIADNSRFIEQRQGAGQLALAIVRVAFVGLWLSAPLGALLLHTGSLGVKLGWVIPTAALFPLFVSISALIAIQSVLLPAKTDLAVSGLVANAERPGAPDCTPRADWQRV